MLAALSHGVSVKFTALLAAYVIALGAGLLARTPAGAGAFDLPLIAILHGHQQLGVALIVCRCIYDLIPPGMALLAIVAQPPQPHAARGSEQIAFASPTGTISRINEQSRLAEDLPFSTGRFFFDALSDQHLCVLGQHKQMLGFGRVFTSDTDWHLHLIRIDAKV